MSSVRMRVAISDWWASRRMVSVTNIFLDMTGFPLQAGVGGDSRGNRQGQVRWVELDRVLGQLRMGFDEAGVELAAAKLRAAQDFLVIGGGRSEEHTSELQSQSQLGCRLL